MTTKANTKLELKYKINKIKLWSGIKYQTLKL